MAAIRTQSYQRLVILRTQPYLRLVVLRTQPYLRLVVLRTESYLCCFFQDSSLPMFSACPLDSVLPEADCPQVSTSATSSSKNFGKLYMQEKIPIGRM